MYEPEKREEIRTLADVLRGISKAVRAGATPNLKNELEKSFYRRYKAAYELGNGDVQKGFEQIAVLEKQAHAQKRDEYPVYALAEDSYVSENPYHRALMRSLIEFGGLSENEAFKNSNQVLAEELQKSSEELPLIQAGTWLPPIEDPMDQKMWRLIQEDISITDTALGQRVGLTRQATNTRRKTLEKMGYSVRRYQDKRS